MLSLGFLPDDVVSVINQYYLYPQNLENFLIGMCPDIGNRKEKRLSSIIVKLYNNISRIISNNVDILLYLRSSTKYIDDEYIDQIVRCLSNYNVGRGNITSLINCLVKDVEQKVNNKFKLEMDIPKFVSSLDIPTTLLYPCNDNSVIQMSYCRRVKEDNCLIAVRYPDRWILEYKCSFCIVYRLPEITKRKGNIVDVKVFYNNVHVPICRFGYGK